MVKLTGATVVPIILNVDISLTVSFVVISRGRVKINGRYTVRDFNFIYFISKVTRSQAVAIDSQPYCLTKDYT